MVARNPAARRLFLATGAAALALTAQACGEPRAVRFITMDAPSFAIVHVRVIDGTGAPGRDDQTVVVQGGRIVAAGSAAAVRPPSAARIIDGKGRTVIPGLVGMHEHLFYQDGYLAQAPFARLYLASGVTTIRTAGAVDFAADRRIKEQIDAGRLPGPKIHLTGGYLDTRGGDPDPERIAQTVNAQADAGATSFKAYMTLRSSELKAAIQAAHARGLKITGHLCAVGFREAAAMGIDNLEHGLAADTEFYSGKQPDVCPEQYVYELTGVDVETDGGIRRTIADLVRHDVAITSTLAVYESFTGEDGANDPRVPAMLASRVRSTYDAALPGWQDRTSRRAQMWQAMLSREMQFERRFVAAGGRLLAGVDPTGWGGVLAGFGDQRELELLVEAGFTPETAIRIATANGADFLNETNEIGTIESGRRADLVLLRGNPSVNISDVRNVEMVFKDGVAYDPAALVAATTGTVGQYDPLAIFRWPFNVILLAILALFGLRIWSHRTRRRQAIASEVAA
jgi:imidazolonepropionase-like amidohydrolase